MALLEGPGGLALFAVTGLFLLPLIALAMAALGLGAQASAAFYRPIGWIDWISHETGRWARWLALWLVLVQFAVVVLRYVFGIGLISLQEALLYFHGTLFLAAAAPALLHDGHVRIDIFYRDLSPQGKALLDLLGSYLFLVPSLALIGLVSLPYVLSAWAVLEGSREASGIPAVFALKTMILIFVVAMLLQGLSFALRAALTLSRQAVPAKPKAGMIIA